MSRLFDAMAFAGAALRQMPVVCATCDKVITDAARNYDAGSDGLTIRFLHHFAFEDVKIYSADDWPRRVFLRTWARYTTTTKPERRRIF